MSFWNCTQHGGPINYKDLASYLNCKPGIVLRALKASRALGILPEGGGFVLDPFIKNALREIYINKSASGLRLRDIPFAYGGYDLGDRRCVRSETLVLLALWNRGRGKPVHYADLSIDLGRSRNSLQGSLHSARLGLAKTKGGSFSLNESIMSYLSEIEAGKSEQAQETRRLESVSLELGDFNLLMVQCILLPVN